MCSARSPLPATRPKRSLTAATAVVPAFAVPHLDNRIVVTRGGSTEEQTLGDKTSYTYQLGALAETLQTGAEFLIDVDDSVSNA
jgi:hypothetical protein